MTAAAYISHVLDPLIAPQFADQDARYEKAFVASHGEDRLSRDCLRALKRSTTYGMDWSGDKLLVSTKDDAVKLFDLERYDAERSWPGQWVSPQIDPNNPNVAALVAYSGKFKIIDTRVISPVQFDVDLKKTVPTMKEFMALRWAPNSEHIALQNRSDQLFLLDLRKTGHLTLGTNKPIPHEVFQMTWSADSSTLWVGAGGSPGTIQVYSAPSLGDQPASVVAHQHSTMSLATDPTGKYIASGGSDAVVGLWDPRRMNCVNTFGFATQGVTSLGFDRTGELLAWGTGGSGSTGGEKNLTIVGANTGCLYAQEPTVAPVQHLCWHPKRNVLAYALNAVQMPEDRNRDDREQRYRSDRGDRNRDGAVIHTLKLPE